MFLLQILIVITSVYWFSASIAEVVMTSPEERSLAPAIRVGLGFFISMVYFAGAWICMSIQQAWILGIFLFILYAYGTGKFSELKSTLIHVQNFVRTYLKTFFMFLLGAGVFFAPLIISNHYGPFTEGGGDVSIYADTAKFLRDNHLTTYGLENSTPPNVIKNVKDAFLPYASDESEKLKYSNALINPPAAESANYRITLMHEMNPLMYAPYAVFGFLAGQTNYGVYFGIQAFVYVCLLAGFFYIFRQINRRIARLATLFIMCSHGVISVFYNNYAMQAESLAMASLIMAILPTIRLKSWAGFRNYGSLLLLIASAYIHYLSVVFPLIFVATILNWNMPAENITKKKTTLIAASVTCIFSTLWLLILATGFYQRLQFALALFTSSLPKFGGNLLNFFGAPVPIFTFKWFSFLFGILSQQHYQPYAIENLYVNNIIVIGSLAGVVALVTGAIVMWRISKSTAFSRYKFYIALYIAIIITIAVHCFIARNFLYMQAKGFQNVLIYFYLILLLPLSIGTIIMKESILIKRILYPAIFTLMATLLFVKVLYTIKIANNEDRSSILESSYFSAATEIRKNDMKAFVLVEPRKSADVYLSVQPFFGMRMVTSRFLVLQKIIREKDSSVTKQIVLASDLISPTDLSHLWTLTMVCKDSNCHWKADKLTDLNSPTLLLSADIYEKDFRIKLQENNKDEAESYSYICNGTAMLFLPHQEGDIKATILPRNVADYANMVKEISKRKDAGEFGLNVKLKSDGKMVTLLYKFEKNNNPTIHLIAHYSGEYWLDVMIRNQHI